MQQYIEQKRVLNFMFADYQNGGGGFDWLLKNECTSQKKVQQTLHVDVVPRIQQIVLLHRKTINGLE